MSSPIRAWDLGITWTPKVCKIIAFRAVIMGLGPLVYIFLVGLGRTEGVVRVTGPSGQAFAEIPFG